MSITSWLLPAILLLGRPRIASGDAFDNLWSQYMQQTEAKKYESTVSRRERNLDHWDVPTAAAYLGLHPETLEPLPKDVPADSSAGDGASSSSASASAAAPTTSLADEYVGHDAAVMFYAQWCQNCHALAPSWDAIATHLDAGSERSKLVMALFDCEKSTDAARLCAAAGIKAYPTMMFVGSGAVHDTDFLSRSLLGADKSAGPFGSSPLRRTVKFQGNWQYPDAVMDWVNLMRGLSSWHVFTESGPLRSIRNGILGLITGGKYKSGATAGGKMSLPVGVPPGFQPELRGPGSSSSVSAQEVKALEAKLNATKKEKGLYEKAVTHSSVLLNGLLFPAGASNGDSAEAGSHQRRDPFEILTRTGGWHVNATTLPDNAPNDEHPAILRTCALELSVDYCTRVTQRVTEDYVKELGEIPENEAFPTMAEMEARLLADVNKVEPYCGTIEVCSSTDFEDESCRPASCPFTNGAACSYVESCFVPSIQDEYGIALGMIEEGEKLSGVDLGKVGKDTAAAAASGVGGWGIPVGS